MSVEKKPNKPANNLLYLKTSLTSVVAKEEPRKKLPFRRKRRKVVFSPAVVGFAARSADCVAYVPSAVTSCCALNVLI